MLPSALDSSPEVWVRIFQELIGDYPTLRNISLVCHTWRTLSWPILLSKVDISSHNIERRLTEHECSAMPIIYSHHHAKYRPRNLVPRQRAFLRLITSQSALAEYVKSFTWTLVWRDTWKTYDNSPLLDIDRETWNVFAKLLNVSRLDLASINDVWDDELVRQNPARLFPKVNDLRLLGWMHRGLVRAIIESIDTTKLRCLKLDNLEDQGTLPGGYPIDADIALDFSKNARRLDISDEEHLIDNELFQRQEAGTAAIFPGPMWLPLRLLSDRSLDSLSLLRIAVPHFEMDIDLRNYYTTFHETARLLRKASRSLKTLVIILEEYRGLY